MIVSEVSCSCLCSVYIHNGHSVAGEGDTTVHNATLPPYLCLLIAVRCFACSPNYFGKCSLLYFGLDKCLTSIFVFFCFCVTCTGILKCKCSQPLCDDSYCLTSYKCFKRVDYITDNQEEVSFGCYDTDRFNVCNGALDTSSQKIRCCDDEDMCNEDLNVVSHLQSSAEPNPVATPVVNTEAPPTPQPGKYSNCLCYCTLHHSCLVLVQPQVVF